MKKSFLLFLLVFFINSTAFTAERFPIPLEKENNLYIEDKIFNVKNINIEATMSRPTVAFKPINFTFEFKEDDNLLEIQKGKIQFNMKMDMGNYSQELKKDGAKYTATAVLPKCMMGGEIWFAKLSFEINNEIYSKVFFFEIPNK